MTYRERREARVERLREWADKREAKAVALNAGRAQYAGDTAFWTQPGRIPERERMYARSDRAWAHTEKAAEMDAKADNIEAAAGRAIYSDDQDATDALQARLVALEGARDRIKAYNASCRRGARDVTLLDAAQQADLLVALRYTPIQSKAPGAFPAYALTNLSGNIARNRERLARMT